MTNKEKEVEKLVNALSTITNNATFIGESISSRTVERLFEALRCLKHDLKNIKNQNA